MTPDRPSLRAADPNWLRQRLANWQLALAAGKGELTHIRHCVWQLDLDGERYCVKGPRAEGVRSGEAALLAALHAEGYPVPRPLWRDDESGLFVLEWVEGETLMGVQRAPKSGLRAARLALCIRELAHLEQAAGLIRSVAPPVGPAFFDADSFGEELTETIRAISSKVDASRVLSLCREVGRLLAAGAPQTLGIVDVLPNDVIVSDARAVFLDFESTGWWWPEKRFCQYFARWQQDEEDRDFHSREFLRHAAHASAERLDAHYLWHDLEYLAAWQELRSEPDAPATAYGLPTGDILDAARARVTWPGACEAANALRRLIAD